jgi:hypothetical protein
MVIWRGTIRLLWVKIPHELHRGKTIMIAFVPMFAAAGYALIYLLFGGGLGGAILIFLVAKMLGK